MNVAALILAAGYSHRFGGDKRKLPATASQTLLEYTVAKYLAVFDLCFVVMRENETSPAAWQGNEVIHVVSQRNPSAGMGDNLALGVKTLQQGVDALAVALADMPLVSVHTLQQLKAQAKPNSIVLPLFNEKRGHPVLFGCDYFNALTGVTGDVGARDVLQAHASAVIALKVDDVGVVDDIDTAQDWERIKNLLT